MLERSTAQAAVTFANMRMLRTKRLLVILGVAFFLFGSYLAAYFSCISIEFGPSKEQSLELASPRYLTGPLSEDIVHAIFEPARLLDATYFRPARWQDRQHFYGEADIPLNALIAPARHVY
jgi:hypothetical protein